MVLVSAVITTHKRTPDIVERALKSVLSQTYADIEVIVVDDSPADYNYRNAVKTMVENHGVIYIPHETCQGACAARNTGLQAAKGVFIAFLDDDDEWLPQKIELQLAKFEDNTALVYCGNMVCDIATNTTKEAIHIWHSGMVFEKLIYGNFIGSTSFPLLRKSCLEEIGGFDVQMQSAQDYDVWLRLAEKYPVDYVQEALVLYYVHEGEQISKNPQKRINGQERLNKKHEEYLKNNRKAFWIRTIKLAPYYAADKQLGKALKYWVNAVFVCPGRIKDNFRFLVKVLCNYIKE